MWMNGEMPVTGRASRAGAAAVVGHLLTAPSHSLVAAPTSSPAIRRTALGDSGAALPDGYLTDICRGLPISNFSGNNSAHLSFVPLQLGNAEAHLSEHPLQGDSIWIAHVAPMFRRRCQADCPKDLVTRETRNIRLDSTSPSTSLEIVPTYISRPT